MSRKGIITPGLVALTLAFFGVSAHADVIMIDSIVDGWQNAVGGTNVSINNSVNPGTDVVEWGRDIGNGQSGYKWDSTDTSFNVNTGVAFSLGKFTHVNEAIGSGAISQVDLSLVLGSFEAPTTIGGTFTFDHTETPNVGGNNCCNDLVTITNPSLNQPFQDNLGTAYYFTLLGFSTNGGVNIVNSFSTVENQDNHADLYAVMTTTPIEPVPEPTTLLLLGSGIVGGALRARRRRRRS